MKKAAMFAGLLALVMCGRAHAGTVHFDPPSATIMPGTASVSFEVSVSWETLATIDVVVAALLVPDGVIPAVVPAAGISDWPCGSIGCSPFPPDLLPPGYDQSVGVGGINFALEGWSSPLLIATLTLDTRGLSAGEEVVIIVDPDFEASLLGSFLSLVAKGVNQEPIAGSATISVIPEPSMLGLFLLVSCAVMARKGRVSP